LRLQDVELQARGPYNTEECLDSLSPREASLALVPIAEDHKSTYELSLRVKLSITGINEKRRPLQTNQGLVFIPQCFIPAEM